MRCAAYGGLFALLACGEPPGDNGGRDAFAPADAGHGPAPDAGNVAPPDAGTASDSGVTAPDTGPEDTGTTPEDTGPADTGVAPADAGNTGRDTGPSIYNSRMFAGCANGYCHGGAQAGGFRLNHSSAQALHASLVNVETSARMYYVLPENVRMSYLINKLEGTQGQLVSGAGDRMPPNGPHFDANQMQVLRRWIETGASDGCPN